MIGYKAFNSDLTCRGFQYEIGKSYEMDGEIEICERGFHFCENISDCFYYYSQADARFAKVEAYGDVFCDDFQSKCVTNKIRILEEIPRSKAIKVTNTGYDNSGYNNSGSYNSGHSNSGHYNSGNLNNGNCNSGDYNSGNCNSGDYNSGDHNSGERNTGDWNTGNRNIGRYNSGDWNSGEGNSGDWNSGDWNSGDWNKSSYNTGCFMTINSFIMMFNKPSNWTILDWLDSNARSIMMDCPYESKHDRQMWWDKLSENDKAEVMSLPNFDADVFYECTWIAVEKDGE